MEIFVETCVLTLKKLFSGEKSGEFTGKLAEFFGKNEKYQLTIPNYQRIYAWDKGHMELLLQDLDEFLSSKNTDKPENYLLGSLIFHIEMENDKVVFNIIDGQQRLTSLSLILYALEQDEKDKNKKNYENDENFGFEKFKKNNNIEYNYEMSKNGTAQANFSQNYQAVKTYLNHHEFEKDNLPEKIEFVRVFTNDLDNAFTFF